MVRKKDIQKFLDVFNSLYNKICFMQKVKNYKINLNLIKAHEYVNLQKNEVLSQD